MKRLLIIACVFFSVISEAASLSFSCPCRNKPEDTGNKICLTCGCGSEIDDSNEIPPYQD